jgi:6-pyruvoyltetrahydropterin/6-carboxytetrahydropterin synthase
MFKITKEFHCCSSHQLSGLPETHPCSNLHGHNYVIKVELKSEILNEVGFIKDYRELESIKNWIDLYMDHKHLNNTFVFNPTAEKIAKELFYHFQRIVPEISAVEVSETPKTNARYEPSEAID